MIHMVGVLDHKYHPIFVENEIDSFLIFLVMVLLSTSMNI